MHVDALVDGDYAPYHELKLPLEFFLREFPTVGVQCRILAHIASLHNMRPLCKEKICLLR